MTVDPFSFMSGLFYEEESLGVFLLVTVVLGGGAAVLAGRAVALTWRPWWQVVAYTLMLAAAVRFIHFALFQGTLLSPHYYAVDGVVCMAFGFAGFQAARARRMVAQYPWINASDRPLRWRRKPR
jgi:GR25 family glycosyltransferase involved in LPS biosynthesis